MDVLRKIVVNQVSFLAFVYRSE